jgi:hypothetical protein
MVPLAKPLILGVLNLILKITAARAITIHNNKNVELRTCKILVAARL